MANNTLSYRFRDALRYAMIHYSDKGVKKGQALRRIAEGLVDIAINGNERDKLAAIKEIGDRLDGKPVQAISGPDGEQLTMVQRIIVHRVLESDSESDTPRIEDATTKVIN